MISVIVPVYNVEKYLRRCIDSILNQTYSDFELILIDDGSTDSSGEICDEYLTKDCRITVYHQSNQGQAAARNNGIRVAKGEWVHFVDADDLIHPQILEILLKAALDNDVLISVCGALEQSECPKPSWYELRQHKAECFDCRSENEALQYYGKPFLFWTAWGKLIKKTLIIDNMFSLGRYYEDNAVVIKWLYYAGRVAYIPEDLYYYQINPTGTTKSGFSIKKVDVLWAWQERMSFFCEKGKPSLVQKQIGVYMKDASFFYYRILRELRNRKVALSIRKEAASTLKRYRDYCGDMYPEYRKNVLDMYPLYHYPKAILRRVTGFFETKGD